MQTVAEVVGKAKTTDDVDLDTGLTKDEAAQRAAFLQVLPEASNSIHACNLLWYTYTTI